MAASDDALRPSRASALAGAATFAWVVLWAVGLVLLQVGRKAFHRYQDLLGNAVVRVVLAVMVGAALFHTLDGARRMAQRSWPAIGVYDEAMRAVAIFLTFALGIPAALVVLWPRLDGVVG